MAKETAIDIGYEIWCLNLADAVGEARENGKPREGREVGK